jgi:hypothetical protein
MKRPLQLDQHPLQMLLILLSTFGSSARISASPGIEGPGETVPSVRPPVAPPALVPALPVVDDPAALPVEGDPDELAVPRVFVPGAVGIFAELPAPLGSSPELLRPPALAGPDGTPLTPAVPAPAEPAFGEPAAVPVVPAEGPLAAPAAPLPAAPPPADPPPDPPPPPPPWALANVDPRAKNSARANVGIFMANLLRKTTKPPNAHSFQSPFAITKLPGVPFIAKTFTGGVIPCSGSAMRIALVILQN